MTAAVPRAAAGASRTAGVGIGRPSPTPTRGVPQNPPVPVRKQRQQAPISPPPPPRRPVASSPRWADWAFNTNRQAPGNSAAGVVLAVLTWGWFILPLLRGGPTEVRNTLRAKFLNKGPDGKWLP